jgi:hypothetical protein
MIRGAMTRPPFRHSFESDHHPAFHEEVDGLEDESIEDEAAGRSSGREPPANQEPRGVRAGRLEHERPAAIFGLAQRRADGTRGESQRAPRHVAAERGEAGPASLVCRIHPQPIAHLPARTGVRDASCRKLR